MRIYGRDLVLIETEHGIELQKKIDKRKNIIQQLLVLNKEDSDILINLFESLISFHKEEERNAETN